MNRDGHHNDSESGLDPELEARIVALLHGELSESHLEGVEAEIADDPAAELYRQRMESLDEMLGEVSGGEEDKEWTLAPERRAHLLETFSTAKASETGQEIVDLEALREKRAQSAGRRVIWSVAACFGFSLFLVTILTQPWIVLERESGAVTELADRALKATDFQAEAVAEAADIADIADGFAASPGELEFAFPEIGEASEAAARQRTLRKPSVAKARVATESPEGSTGQNVQEAADALEASEEETVSPPVAARRAPVRPEGLSDKELSLSAASADTLPPGIQAETIAQAMEIPQEVALESPTNEAESFTEPSDEEAGGGEKKREVAFLGLGLVFGLLLGLLFGLGLGRTWQRRAHSSH